MDTIEPIEKEINGHKYVSQAFPARKGLRIGVRVGKIVGPALGALGDAAIKDGADKVKDGDLPDGAVTNIVQLLCDNVDDMKVEQLILDILGRTQRINKESGDREDVGKGSVFDLIYQGNYAEMMQAVGLALEANHFFGQDAIGKLAKMAGKMMQSGGASPNNSETDSTPS